MDFAAEWLEKRAIFPGLFKEPPDPRTGIIIVVPAFDEPGIAALLNSLAFCRKPDCKTEIIIIINAPPSAGSAGLVNNGTCMQNILSWKRDNQSSHLNILPYNAGQPPVKGWGAGLARKAGMDEALRRFSSIGKPGGVIVSLDADCTVDENYLTEIQSNLLDQNKRNACSIWFEHPVSGNDFSGDVYRYAAKYELHMRYFYQAVKYSGYPSAFHSIGSAFACKADTYLRAGGMNRKQAGEDFYFIQKLVPQGGYFDLNTTTVYPSPRTSSRVPFGTGPVIKRMLEEKSDILLTYNPEAFRDLRKCFSLMGEISSREKAAVDECYDRLPDSLKSFTGIDDWSGRIKEIRDNTSGEDAFRKRFFSWFNMFRMVKYLNHTHRRLFRKIPVEEAAFEMLSMAGLTAGSMDPIDLLAFYRMLERKA